MEKTAVFECGICFSVYDNGEHLPLSLPCGHVYCKGCMTLYCPGDHVTCPADKITHNTVVERLPCCFAILSNLPRSPGRCKKVCCPKHMKKIKFQCRVHAMYLCSSCVIDHTGAGHDIVAFSVTYEQMKSEAESLNASAQKLYEEAREAAQAKLAQEKRIKSSFQHVIELAEKVVDLQAPEVKQTSDWAYIIERPFIYCLRKRKDSQKSETKAQGETGRSLKKHHRHRHSDKNATEGRETVRNKDKILLDLITCYKQLETLYQKVRRGESVKEEPKPVERVIRDEGEEDDDQLLYLVQRNRDLEDRIACDLVSTLESTVQSRAQSRMMTPRARVTISALRSDSSQPLSTPDSSLRLYVPFGHPSYTYFYYVSLDEVQSTQDVSTSELLSVLYAHIDMQQGDFVLTMKRSRNGSEVRLYNSERPIEVVGQTIDGWPRLYLQPSHSSA